jgi:hypothetical protein
LLFYVLSTVSGGEVWTPNVIRPSGWTTVIGNLDCVYWTKEHVIYSSVFGMGVSMVNVRIGGSKGGSVFSLDVEYEYEFNIPSPNVYSLYSSVYWSYFIIRYIIFTVYSAIMRTIIDGGDASNIGDNIQYIHRLHNWQSDRVLINRLYTSLGISLQYPYKNRPKQVIKLEHSPILKYKIKSVLDKYLIYST